MCNFYNPGDILIKITVCNLGNEDAILNVLPQLWFRNTWDWGYDDYKPNMYADKNSRITIEHKEFDEMILHYDQNPEILFSDNETMLKDYME